MTRQAFIIRVPGHATYTGVFPNACEARLDAQRRFPTAWPATVINLSQQAAQRRASKC